MIEPYYDVDGITIYHGDCRDVLPHIKADMVVTDPPYNIGCEYLSYDDSMTTTAYKEWVDEWWALLPAAGRLVFCGVGNLKHWTRLDPVAIGCWYKPGSPSRANPFQWNEWEPVLLWGLAFAQSDVWRYPTSRQPDVGNHPCPKPIGLLTQILKKCKNKGAILDPFVGSGTTLVAAKRLGRKAIGIEIEEKYCEIAVKRLAQTELFREVEQPRHEQLAML